MNTKTKLRRVQDFAKFESIYEKLEEIFSNEFQDIVRKKNNRLWLCFFFMLITITTFTIGLWKYSGKVSNSTAIIITLIAFLTMFMIVFIALPRDKKFTNKFKQRIVGTMLKQMHPNLNYSPVVISKKNVLTNYTEFGFEPSNCNGEYVDDEIRGSICENISIQMCNLSVIKSTSSGTSTLFNGLFAQIDLDKSVDADIRLLLPENHYLGNDNDIQKFQMDNTDFEKQFNVYTNNKLITNQLLTSEIMEQLKSYCQKYGILFELVIKNGRACVRIETGPMFESFSTKNKLHKEDTFVYYSILNFTFELLTDIYNIVKNTDI